MQVENQSSASPSTDVTSESLSIKQRIKAMFAGKKNEEEQTQKTVPFRELFAYATRAEMRYMWVSIPSAAVHGAILPLFTIVFGSVINVFGGTDDTGANAVPLDEITSTIGGIAKWFLVLAAVAFVTSFLQVRFQLIFAHRVTNRLRRLYFQSLMRQDCTWYDSNDGGELTARVAGDVNLVQAGIGEKVATAVQFIFTFVVGFIIALIYGWKLTLIILSVAPLLALGGVLFGKLAAESTSDSQKSYGAAGGVASEVLSLIRTVTAYNGQESEAKRYDEKLQEAYRFGIKRSAYSGGALGFTYGVIFCTFAVAFTFGAGQVRSGAMEPGDIIVTFFSVFIGTISIGQASPAFNAFSIARGAAPRVYDVIRRKSAIDPLDGEGEILDNVTGEIEFRDVQFNYPTRTVDDQESEARPHVLDNFNLKVSPGSSHALVGSSGCGKSTTVRLIERFYDVQEGQVLLDGGSIRNLNVRWLRSQIGYVGQMPTLFMLTIRENIALGAAMEKAVDPETGEAILRRKEVTDEEIVAAAKKANAHDFIMKLPEKYDTLLGERGAMLSGGQKQRVCIARALVRNPKILLLDESTSALDAQSERIVQEALEQAAEGRTTITIAHRLSTVKNADVISVIDEGRVVEEGDHNSLLNIEGGAYRTLVEFQNVEGKKQKEEKEEEDSSVVLQPGVDDPTKATSLSKTLVEQEDKGELPAVDKGVLRRALKMSLPDLPFILIGMLGAAVAGASFPVMAITFTEVIEVTLRENKAGDVTFWACMFVLIGGLSFVGYFVQHAMLGISGERLTRKLRSKAFRSILRQDIGFFDAKENSVGQLTTRLATEATLVKGLAGDALGGVAMVSTLVVTVIFPAMGLSEAMNIKMISGFDSDSGKKFAKAGAVASEAVDNFDTVSSIGVQDIFIEKYNEELELPLRNGRRAALTSGIAYGVAEALAQILWAISFWVGAIFVERKQCTFPGLMKAVSGLLFAGSSLGQASLFLPDIGKSRVAATKLFRLLDRSSSIDPTSEEGTRTGGKAIDGSVAMQKLKFEYPTRPDVPVLRGLTVDIEPGKTLALVGASGSGKSTVVSLIERFYDPRSGMLMIDDVDVKDYHLRDIRGQIGLVSQEPDLFHRSVRDNIAYGLSQEEGTPVTESMIVEAAKAANAHDFISQLPEGYETDVGTRGSKLSGGQRQRVAIARSLVRAPRVLLLDEATSALDAVSERTVQDALDAASHGRTTIAVAHRLSTIKDADMIAVVQNGKIVEKGTHDELLSWNGAYARLVENQMSEAS
ncbi:unnamed protein product [Agarophyton chilense]